jgi:hypothetical protein
MLQQYLLRLETAVVHSWQEMKIKGYYEIKTRADMRSADNKVFRLANRGNAYQLQIVGAS